MHDHAVARIPHRECAKNLKKKKTVFEMRLELQLVCRFLPSNNNELFDKIDDNKSIDVRFLLFVVCGFGQRFQPVQIALNSLTNQHVAHLR